METKRFITVIGSSGASNFAETIPDPSWPALLAQNLNGSAQIDVHIRGALTPVRCIDVLAGLEPCDLLILHIGTAVGWPIAFVAINNRFGIDFEAEHGLHQPAFRSPLFRRRIKGFLKAKFRNFVKYLLFFTGLYRPRVNYRELDDQVKALLRLAFQKAPKVVWIQHRALHNRRIILERTVYARYYKRIIDTLQKMKNENLSIIPLGQEFLIHENYLLDYVHLSPDGHKEIYKKVREVI